jgi:hypothetical protein
MTLRDFTEQQKHAIDELFKEYSEQQIVEHNGTIVKNLITIVLSCMMIYVSNIIITLCFEC